MSNSNKYTEIFDYLSAPELPTDPEAMIVFGRNDPLVAQKAGELVTANLAEVLVITGFFGKDSGDLRERGFRSEAHFLGDELEKDARERGYSLPAVMLEEAAKHGGENASFSVDMLMAHNYNTDSLTAVTHATSSRRLAETLKFQTEKKTGNMPTIHRAPDRYTFDPKSPIDQAESVAEFRRLLDFPEQGLLYPQTDLPENLVDFVLDNSRKATKPPSPLVSAIFSKLHPKIQSKIMKAHDRLTSTADKRSQKTKR